MFDALHFPECMASVLGSPSGSKRLFMINSQQNVHIKDARKLQERRHRHQRQQFLIEGVRLIGDAMQSGMHPDLLFYAPQLVEKNHGATHLLSEIEKRWPSIDCLACSPSVFKTLSDTVTPQGIAALFSFPQLVPPAVLDLILVLDKVREPGNAGTLLRSAEAAGVGQVIFGPDTVDPFNSKVVRSAMGSHFRLPIEVCPAGSQIDEHLPCRHNIFLAQAGAVYEYDQVDWRQPSVLIVSGETAGASLMSQKIAQPISIPMLGSLESLNVAM